MAFAPGSKIFRNIFVNILFTLICCLISFGTASFRQFADEPLQLVKPDLDHKRLVLVKENIKVVSRIEGPVATIAVVGKFHSGKSFLMNQLMGKTKGFGIGPTVRPETMGIWMWGQPLKVSLPSGQKLSLIFLDTEGNLVSGFAANNVSENYDAKIFAVATLISSHLIYNSVKIIDQADIDYLELLARRTQLFALRSQLSRAKWNDGFVHDLLSFPPLLWVVQDFVQTTLDNETPTQWLHRLMETHTRESEDYKISLLDIFKSLECHTLFLPAVKRLLLTDLSEAREEDLTEEYIEERDALSKRLQETLVPKTKNGRPITGAELTTLFEVLVEASNDGSLADVPSRWTSFVERIMDSSTEDCTHFYESEMRVLFKKHDDGPIKDGVFVSWHSQARKKSFTLLTQLLHGLSDALETATAQLEKNLESLHARQRDLNSKKIKLFCSNQEQKYLLTAEGHAKGIALPLSSAKLKQDLGAYAEGLITDFNKELETVVEEEDKKIYTRSLKQSLGHLVDATQLQNERALEAVFEKAVASASETFSSKAVTSKALTDQQLGRVTKEGVDAAFQTFDSECKKFSREKKYGLHEALLKDVINRHIEELKNQNDQLISKLMANTVKKLVERFTERTGPQYLSLPVNDTDLDLRLQQEGSTMQAEFKRSLDGFQSSPSYKGFSQELLEQLRSVEKQRRAENVDAFTRVVGEPLTRAKQIILLSADKFGTEFTLRTFIMDVCLLQLGDGKPKFWQQDLKRNIVTNFMNTDPELRQMIARVKGLWSSVVGFFLWILWLIGF
ncbi:unnamed protein product [Ixodes hexagonus]